MNPNEPRSVWLVTRNGVPHHFRWALVKLASEVDAARLPDALRAHPPATQCAWAAALGADELPSDGWDATRTAWRRLPLVLYPNVLEQTNPSLVNRELHAGGCVFNLDESGRPHPGAAPGSDMEPLEPDGIINNEAVFADVARRTGAEMQVCRKTDRVKVIALPAVPPTGLPNIPGTLVLALNHQGRLVRTGP